MGIVITQEEVEIYRLRKEIKSLLVSLKRESLKPLPKKQSLSVEPNRLRGHPNQGK